MTATTPTPSSTQHVTWLGECEAVGREAVGGKALGLGSLTRLSLPVPPGFALTTAAYREHLDATGLGATVGELIAEAADSLDARAEASQRIRGLFERSGVCDAVSEELHDAYRRLGEPPVAVRSSADTEDTDDASFAGQQESFLWVAGADALRLYVARCWASLFTPQAIAYRADRAIPPEEIAMGVVVQEMVPASAGGVMMTLDPLTGDRSQITIEGCYGLAVGVVSGEVTPDRFAVDKVTLDLRSREAGYKHQRFDHARAAGGVEAFPVPDDERQRPCLTNEEVRQLASLGKQVERALGAPQDVEWCFGPGEPGSRELFLLQTRPETVWSPKSPTVRPNASGTVMDRLLQTMTTPVKLK